LGRKDKEIERKSQALQSRIATLNFEFESIKDELKNDFTEQELRNKVMQENLDKETYFRDSKSNGKKISPKSGNNKR